MPASIQITDNRNCACIQELVFQQAKDEIEGELDDAETTDVSVSS